MLSIARDLYPLCTFEYADIEKPLVYSDNEYDIVFCNQVLMDIENLDNIIKETYRITKYNGTFFMSIVHPAFYDCEWDKDQTGFKKEKLWNGICRNIVLIMNIGVRQNTSIDR